MSANTARKGSARVSPRNKEEITSVSTMARSATAALAPPLTNRFHKLVGRFVFWPEVAAQVIDALDPPESVAAQVWAAVEARVLRRSD